MALVDMHVHSIHSEHPSEWFLQRIGAAESYTDPEFIYKTAKDKKMNFVTITDHNRIIGSLKLKEKYPNDAFTGVESTVYFPEDRTKVHILIYGLTERQFEEIQRLRKDIYQFRAYISQENLAYSVAHATYSVNNKLTINHLEKLFLLFDVFEGINGGRNYPNNIVLVECLKKLSPDKISDFFSKYKIEPISTDPWIKGITGGSDDHGGLFIGQTYTIGEAETVHQFLNRLKDKKTVAGCRHNDYKSLAFTIYKIAYDYSKEKSLGIQNPIIQQSLNSLFDKKPTKFMSKFSLFNMFNKKRQNDDPVKEKIYKLLNSIDNYKRVSTERQFSILYSNIAEVADQLFIDCIKKIVTNISNGDFLYLIKDFSSVLPAVFLSLPFFSTLKHMHNSKELLAQLKINFDLLNRQEKSILWFTDTFNDLNGVSVTLNKIAEVSTNNNDNIKIITCSTLQKDTCNKSVINLESVYSFKLPYYETYELSIPSLLKTVETLSDYNPTEIIISTPGPVGLTGLLLAKLLNIPVYGIYHTDFTKQYDAIDEESDSTQMIENYIKWFYQSLDKILVPTETYKDILSERGYNSEKMSIFQRGIDSKIYYKTENKKILKDIFNIKDGINLLYSGRISKDKNLDFLINLYLDYFKKNNEVNLVLAGDGPYLKKLKKEYCQLDNIYFLGRLNKEQLTSIYSECDIFTFPSNTDTFGMVVLEALACGLPCIVSDTGGPKDLVIPNENGFICNTNNQNEWEKALDKIISILTYNQNEYQLWRNKISQKTHSNYSIEKMLNCIKNIT